MGFWKDLVDKAAKKKEEIEEEAKKRAAKKAAEVAIETGKAAAKSAVRNAGKTLDYAGRKLEEAIFGDAPDSRADTPTSSSSRSSRPPKKDAPDPFAKLKADEAARKASAKEREKDEKAAAKARAEARARTEREVDDELAALKKKIRGDE